mmetsp:Transcript_24346/g.48560  ORF Transcript_24346/g.48560 Transcript_24346/m.48560 type:complete len:568 (+) Transcript_24346:178-1881(+)
MLTYPLALTALLAGSATAVSRSTKQEFIRAMRKHNLDPMIMADAAKSSALKKSIMDEAIMVPAGRKLEDAAAGYYSSNSNNQNVNYNQNYVQGTDDAYSFNQDVDWENDWGFDASQYSLSYERCATVKHFDVEKAAEEDATSPFRTQHFAVLRLCPAKTCDSPDWYITDDAVAEDAEEQETEAEEYAETYGANGRGCQSNYATFLLDAGEYMSLMTDYEDTQFEMYCNYCDHYMQQQYEKWVQNGGGRHLEFEEFKNDEEVQRKLGGDMAACSVMAKACGNGFQDDYADYLECNQVEKNNGMVAYAQATCAEDGQTITIGLYSDEECSEDISSQVNIANWIGEEVDDEEMAHYYKNVASAVGTLIETYGGETNVNPNSLCMPCAAQDQAWFLSGDDDNTGGGEIAEICDAVFKESARCDKTLSNWWQHKRNANYAESVALQDVSCEYIDNMRMGKYDTEGNVIMDANRLYNEDGSQGINGNLYVQEYGQGLTEVSPMQIFSLVLSICACVILGAWSTTLHKSLTKGGLTWKPKRGVAAGADEVDVSRQGSGIVMGRSQSNNTSYYMS